MPTGQRNNVPKFKVGKAAEENMSGLLTMSFKVLLSSAPRAISALAASLFPFSAATVSGVSRFCGHEWTSYKVSGSYFCILGMGIIQTLLDVRYESYFEDWND